MFLDQVKNARCHRGFCRERKVSREELLYLVQCARFTPSARNGQVLKYYLANEEETVASILALTRWAGALPELELPRKGAEPQAFVVICLDKNLTDSPAAFQRDVGIVAQTMFLAAGELGLNGCMIGSFAAASRIAISSEVWKVPTSVFSFCGGVALSAALYGTSISFSAWASTTWIKR